jgi:hypothetical protein
MEEIVLKKHLIAGVVAAMVVFGVIALIGYHRQGNKTESNDQEN